MYLALLPFIISIHAIQSDLSEIRLEFSKISDNHEIQAFYHAMLDSEDDDAIHTAYQGTAYCMMAKTAFNPFEKLRLFNQGKHLIDHAVNKEPKNIEIRLLRNLIQCESPKFLNYSCNYVEDREIIEETFGAESNQSTLSIYHLFIQNEMEHQTKTIDK